MGNAITFAHVSFGKRSRRYVEEGFFQQEIFCPIVWQLLNIAQQQPKTPARSSLVKGKQGGIKNLLNKEKFYRVSDKATVIHCLVSA